MDISNLLGDALKKQALTQIAQKVGGDNALAQKLIAQALPSVLGALEKNTATDAGKKSLDTALEKHTGETKIDMADGAKILGHLFGDKKENEIKKISENTGVTQNQSSDAMSILSSLVMEKLGDQKKSGLGVDDISKMLSGASKNKALSGMPDHDGDGDFDSNDAMKFGLGYVMKKFLGKK